MNLFTIIFNIALTLRQENQIIIVLFIFFQYYAYNFNKCLVRFLSHNIILFYEKNKHPCKLLRYLFDDETNANTCNENCLRIKKVLRFGNSMIQLLNIIQIANVTGIKNVYFPNKFLLQKKSFSIKGINFFVINSTKTLNCYTGIFYERSKKLPKLPFFIDPDFKKLFQKSLYQMSLPKDALVIHVRAGDVFKRIFNINFKYGQPPCNYYLDVIRMKNWSQVILIAEDSSNPCVKVISKKANVKFKPRDLTTDLSILINAPNLALSRGSFCYAIILLSKNLKNIYTFNQSSSKIPDHFNCIPTDDFYNSVVKYWKKSRVQIKKIINSKCLQWEFIPKGPKNADGYIHDVNL